MKRTMRFNTEEEMNNYFPDGVPNNVLGIVDNPTGNNVLYTSSNNQIVTGEEEGGYITAPEDLARIAALEEGKADKTELVGLASETWVENKNYLTEHQSLNGYATEAYVSAAIEAIPATDLTGYATEAYVMGKGFLTEHQSLSGYATEAYVTSKIEDVVGAAPAALDTLKEIGDSLNNDADFAGTMTSALAGKANTADVYTKSEIDNAGFLTSHQDLSDYALKSELPVVPSLNGYATESYVANYVSTYAPTPDLSGYVSKSELSNCGYITAQDVPAPDLSAYVSKTELSNCGYITAQDVPAPDLSAYVSKTELEGMSYATQSYVSSNFIEKQTNTEIENGSIYLKDDEYNNGGKISFYSGSNKYSPYLYINGHERGFNGLAARILAQGDLYIQNGASNGNIKMLAAYLFSSSAYTYIAGIGNYDGYDKTNAYSLQDVINEIQTTLGTAVSVAEIIVGNNS